MLNLSNLIEFPFSKIEASEENELIVSSDICHILEDKHMQDGVVLEKGGKLTLLKTEGEFFFVWLELKHSDQFFWVRDVEISDFESFERVVSKNQIFFLKKVIFNEFLL